MYLGFYGRLLNFDVLSLSYPSYDVNTCYEEMKYDWIHDVTECIIHATMHMNCNCSIT